MTLERATAFIIIGLVLLAWSVYDIIKRMKQGWTFWEALTRTKKR